ncbi:MAG: M28 family peptidase [Sphingobacteriales bacterium]|nr:MAG: M28 family peptidase [Sphingobacteriales bacterium]
MQTVLSRLLLVWAVLSVGIRATAQNPKALKYDVRILTGASFSGRGYVDKGCEKAARYLVRRLKEAGVAPATPDTSYLQAYSFPVNTFPLPLQLVLNKKELRPGIDYLVEARNPSFATEKAKVRRVDVARTFEKTDSAARIAALSAQGGVVLFQHADTVVQRSFLRASLPPDSLPAGLYLVPVKGKMTWTVRTRQLAKGATVVYVQDSVLPKKVRKITTQLPAKLVGADKNRQFNVCGMIPGTAQPDSFIVFTAHYDHLGEMGKGTVFPGASDNASGTATVLDLARYYAQHPQRYSMLFVFFSGEEAGLLGSQYYTEHPIKPLDRIRFLINLDMVGECAEGASVVNATKHPEVFAQLEQLNKEQSLLPNLKAGGEASNSDHYHFSKLGVPAFFIFGNGGKGHYHDVFDTAEDLSLTHTENLQKLLIRFVSALQ